MEGYRNGRRCHRRFSRNRVRKECRGYFERNVFKVSKVVTEIIIIIMVFIMWVCINVIDSIYDIFIVDNANLIRIMKNIGLV